MDVEKYLVKYKINYTKHLHKAVFTVDESKELDTKIPGIHTKNLFLKDESNEKYFLVCIKAEKRADLKQIAKIFNVKRLTFAKPKKLKEYLGLTPGSVSVFGLINNTSGKVDLLLDKEITEAKIVNFHPNVNTATLSLNQGEFKKYLDTLDNKIIIKSL
jgi:Ala-tRNA(Pro) deacylase